MSVFILRDDGLVTDQQEVCHMSLAPLPSHVANGTANVTLLYSPQDDTSVQPSLRHSLWSYLHPGCIVYQWDVASKQLLNRLDCSKLVPCSESLKSISIEEHLSPSHCQVTAMAVCGEELLVGTAWGCVVIAEACSMRPVTVFRPFEADVLAIVPLSPPQEDCPDHERQESLPPMVATIGRGYRNLLRRYAPVEKSHDGPDDPQSSFSLFCLIWRSHQWINS